MRKNDTSVLMEFLSVYCDVNGLGPDWEDKLRRALENQTDQTVSEKFKLQLTQAITNNTVSPQDIEYETSWDIETEEEKITWLSNLWRHLYDTEPPTG